MIAQFQHDCTADTLVAVISDESLHCDVYRQCGGRGYIIRWSDEGSDYESSVGWTLATALDRLHWKVEYDTGTGRWAGVPKNAT